MIHHNMIGYPPRPGWATVQEYEFPHLDDAVRQELEARGWRFEYQALDTIPVALSRHQMPCKLVRVDRQRAVQE